MTTPLLVVVGARPNMVKVAPVWHALAALGIEQRLLHMWDGRAGQRAARAVAAFLATDATTPAR